MDVPTSVGHSIHNNTASTSYKTRYDRPEDCSADSEEVQAPFDDDTGRQHSAVSPVAHCDSLLARGHCFIHD